MYLLENHYVHRTHQTHPGRIFTGLQFWWIASQAFFRFRCNSLIFWPGCCFHDIFLPFSFSHGWMRHSICKISGSSTIIHPHHLFGYRKTWWCHGHATLIPSSTRRWQLQGNNDNFQSTAWFDEDIDILGGHSLEHTKIQQTYGAYAWTSHPGIASCLWHVHTFPEVSQCAMENDRVWPRITC